MYLTNLDVDIILYLDSQAENGNSAPGFTALMEATGAQVNELCASVLRLEEMGLISPGPGPWPLYRLADCQENAQADASRGLLGGFMSASCRETP